MGLFSTLSTGVTGLGVNSVSLAVAGDNLANLNTTGFKGSRAGFQDLIIQNIASRSRSSQLGMGSFLGSVSQEFTQGSIATTGRTADMAVDGSGFFVVRSSEGQFYTRAGQFTVDQEGRLSTMTGYTVQGYQARDGELTSSVGDITLPTEQLSPSATGEVQITANLDAEADVVAGWGGTVPTTYDDVDDADYTYSTSMTVYDSLGASHDVVVYFQKTASDTWEYYATVDAGDVGGTEGEIQVLESGTLGFDGDGNLDSVSYMTSPSSVTFEGASAQAIEFDLGYSATGEADGALTQYAGSSTVTGIVQDGYGAGDLIDWQVDTDGTVSGIYSNGETQVLGQVALAIFGSTEGLTRAGDNLWIADSSSGDPLIGAAETGGRGSVHQYALEGSNVDIEREFVGMITAQRGYQASARVVSTTDQLLQELVQIL